MAVNTKVDTRVRRQQQAVPRVRLYEGTVLCISYGCDDSSSLCHVCASTRVLFFASKTTKPIFDHTPNPWRDMETVENGYLMRHEDVSNTKDWLIDSSTFKYIET